MQQVLDVKLQQRLSPTCGEQSMHLDGRNAVQCRAAGSDQPCAQVLSTISTNHVHRQSTAQYGRDGARGAPCKNASETRHATLILTANSHYSRTVKSNLSERLSMRGTEKERIRE